MHLQVWDPYYFSPFGVETKLRSYSMVGARISSSHFSPLFSFFCFNYSFRFFFVHSCLFRSYSIHSHRVSLAGPNFCHFSAVSLLLLFIYFVETFVSSVQFCGFICRIAYCFVFAKFRLCSHRVISKTTNTFKTEIQFCNFRIWWVCRQIPLPLINVGRLSMDLSHANVAYEFCMGLQFRAVEIPTLRRMGRGRRGGEGGGGRGTGKIVSSCLKLSGIDLLIRFNLRIIHKNYEIIFYFVQWSS